MKKATITRSELGVELIRIAQEIEEIAAFDLEDPAIGEIVDPAAFSAEFFCVGEPSPAPQRGRGLRVILPVGWVWWPAPMAAQDGASVIAKKVGAISGVERVTAPVVDPQFGLVWSVDVTIRVTQ